MGRGQARTSPRLLIRRASAPNRMKKSTASLIGYYAFSEIPDVFTVVGAGLIIAAGLILLKRQRG